MIVFSVPEEVAMQRLRDSGREDSSEEAIQTRLRVSYLKCVTDDPLWLFNFNCKHGQWGSEDGSKEAIQTRLRVSYLKCMPVESLQLVNLSAIMVSEDGKEEAIQRCLIVSWLDCMFHWFFAVQEF